MPCFLRRLRGILLREARDLDETLVLLTGLRGKSLVKSIGLVVRSDVPDAIPLAKELVKWCKDNGHAVVGSKETASISGVTLDKVVPEDDLAFVWGWSCLFLNSIWQKDRWV